MAGSEAPLAKAWGSAWHLGAWCPGFGGYSSGAPHCPAAPLHFIDKAPRLLRSRAANVDHASTSSILLQILQRFVQNCYTTKAPWLHLRF
jgi:hypothetical protein